jgi:hypothetical protein
VLSEIYKTEFTSRRDFVRVLIAWRLWAAYERKSNIENAMTVGIELFVFLQPPCLDVGLRDCGTLRGPTQQEATILAHVPRLYTEASQLRLFSNRC